MPEQTPLTRPEIIAFPGDNAELPAKSLERQIYADPERFKRAMKLGAIILQDVIDTPDEKNNIVADSDEVKQAKNLVQDNLRTILEDESLRKSIWFDDETEARFEKDTKYNELRRASPRTEKILKEMRLRQFAIFTDSVIEYQSHDKPQKSGLRRTG